MPLPVPSQPWEVISMDFVTHLPQCDGYDAILTVVCTLTKMAHFIPCTSKVNAKQLAKLFLDNIYRLHGLPRIIIGDRDTRYTSTFFRNLMEELRTKLSLSTAYHPQTDGNTERCHRTIEQILRAYVHEDHYEWLRTLSLAEFSYNNNVHSSTGFSPFAANYGFDPRVPINLITPPVDMSDRSKEHSHILRKLLDIHKVIQDQLEISKAVQKHYADKRTDARIEFNEGDYVLLSTQNLKLLNQKSKKFKTRFIGPYLIEKKVSSQAYKLKLPNTMKVHPVFHISLLKEYRSNNPEQDTPDEIPAVGDQMYGEEFIVDHIVDHKTGPFPDYYEKGPALLFRTKWEGYGPEDDTWQVYADMRKTVELDNYIKSSDKFRLFLLSDEYKKLSRAYPERFPMTLRYEVPPPIAHTYATRSSRRGRNVRGT